MYLAPDIQKTRTFHSQKWLITILMPEPTMGDVGASSLDCLSAVDVADANRRGLGLAVVIKVVRPDDRIFMGGSSWIGRQDNHMAKPHLYGRAGLFEQPIDLRFQVGFGGSFVDAVAGEIAAVDGYGLWLAWHGFFSLLKVRQNRSQLVWSSLVHHSGP
jgi:hypothetical protein